MRALSCSYHSLRHIRPAVRQRGLWCGLLHPSNRSLHVAHFQRHVPPSTPSVLATCILPPASPANPTHPTDPPRLASHTRDRTNDAPVGNNDLVRSFEQTSESESECGCDMFARISIVSFRVALE